MWRVISTKWLRVLLVLAGLVSMALPGAAADYNREKYRYELASEGVGTNETVLYRVVCYVKTPLEVEAVASACAVHGVIFSGSVAANGNPAQTPLCKDDQLSEDQIAYFDQFFDKKQYKPYVVAVAKNSIRIVKIKKEYRAEVVVSVNKRKLRRDLEQAGMIEKLGAVFEP